ncbi:hypothetical protein [Arhodomonas sp. AD133]|uniref:hypothetical protein n=1 Tax=Arhodomonas sp. AD133 TaxID=3415009 RepID=UPI003EB99132
MSEELSDAAAEILGSELGYEAEYEGTLCRALRQYNLEVPDSHGYVIEVQIAITLPRELGIPRNGETIVIGSETYRVARLIRYDDYVTVSSCTLTS